MTGCRVECATVGVYLGTTGIFVGDTVDVLVNMDINDWMGRKSLQIIIRDIIVATSHKSTDFASANSSSLNLIVFHLFLLLGSIELNQHR